ncbi:coat protein [uncultured Caudovirales phage]|uniref:Coat protein n=1 Tax=uncultured Caudovirales phage TaxID=2100421 RepID=A0A6J5NPC5_9CAUD|nr:coat protein [uncultured Caudovirales phage]CAB4160723.1 coat protein [uncultured Caudovirales phage]
MSNSFSKEERVAFEDLLEGFQDALVLSRNVSVYNTDQTMMERANNTIWRPQPYIAQSINSTPGTPIPGYQGMTQLAVPATLGFSKTVPWEMTSLELRDALQEGRLGDSAKQKLASDINIAIMNAAAGLGSLVVPIAAAAGDYDDVALCDAIMNEQGVPDYDRFMALSSRDYNGLAGNLVGTARSFGNQKSDKAYERSYVGMVAGFDTYKMDYANRQTAAAGGGSITIDTSGAGTQANYAPQATSTSVGGQINVDNRFQTVTVSSTTSVAAGDAFTIAGVFAVHHITKQSTGQLKTFRVVSVTNSTTMVITPPIIGAQSVATDAQLQYKNVEVSAPSNTAAITFLNVNAASVNVFWQRDSLEILPGRYAVPADAGVAVMRATTDQGIELVLQKFYDIDSMTIKYRMDTLFGVVNKNPEMSGILLFNQ